MKRWYVYAFIGLIFGIFDWFFLDWLAKNFGPSLDENPFIVVLIMLGLNYGIWLVPLIPVCFYEARQAKSMKGPAFTGMLTWSSAILSYYAYYAILFSLGRLPNLDNFSISSQEFREVRAIYWRWFNQIILFQLIEWIPIAIIGGGLTGAFIWWIFQRKSQSKPDL